ncbi:MAG: serine/threonine protein kinase [Deltaproteobacteria bacterium]|nr:serine/threonine protein kinase [Deltaproteobacteria bacterium]
MRICPECHQRYPDALSHCPRDGSLLQELDTRSSESQPGEDQAAAALPADYDLDNRVVGPYRLEEVLAEGGMGVIFQAEHIRLGRKVALKMLRPEYATNRTAIARFFREARAVNAIHHEHIIEITDFIEEAEGDNYYVMELLEGKSLKELLASTGALPVPRALSIGLQIADALQAVHEAGIVHRDLKPSNVFLIHRYDNPDYVKLLDFGVAKVLDQPEDDIHRTVDGTVLGTAAYMSPEQAMGRPVDARTDIYSLGVVIFEMLTGQLPIDGDNFSEIISRKLSQEPLRPSQLPGPGSRVPDTLEKILMQCLMRDPSARFASMAELNFALRRVGRAGSVIIEPRASSAPAKRRRSLLLPGLLTFALALALALMAGIFFLQAPDPPPADPRPPEPDRAAAEPKPDRATVEDPADRQAETQAARVDIRFESRPPGAAVYRQGETSPLGITPVTLSFEQRAESAAFELRLADHRSVQREISLAESSSVSIRMPRHRPPVDKKKKKKKQTSGKKPPLARGDPALDRGGTVDPFSD